MAATHSEKKKLRPMNDEQLSHTFEQLSMLLGAGIPPAEALDIMLRDKDNKELSGAYQILLDQLMKGASLNEAARESGLVPAYAIQLLKIGELTGSLDDVCSRLSSFYEAESELRGALRDAFYYPMIMAVMIATMYMSVLVGHMVGWIVGTDSHGFAPLRILVIEILKYRAC